LERLGLEWFIRCEAQGQQRRGEVLQL
jgi:hypothetical protein